MIRTSLRLLLLVVIAFGFPAFAAGGKVYFYATIIYDQPNLTVTGYAATVVNYSTAYYYDSVVSARFTKNGNNVSSSASRNGHGSAEIWIGDNDLSSRATYELFTRHHLDAVYRYQEIAEECEPHCEWWGDKFGFSLLSAGGGSQKNPSAPVASTPPAEVVYSIFLKELVTFQKKAGDLERQGKDGGSWRTRHQEITELSDRQFATVRDIATSCMTDVQTYDEQAAVIIAGVKNSVRAAGPGARVPPVPQELLELEQKRKARVLAAVEEIRTALGPGAFLYFDMLVRSYLASNLSQPQPAGARK